MYFNNLATILSIIGYSIVVIDTIIAIALKMRKKLGKKSVIIAIVCILVVGSGVSIGAKFLPNGDNKTTVLSVTVTATTTTLVSAKTVTTVPSITPTHPKPAATPTPGLTTAPRTPTPVFTPTPAICQAPCNAEYPDGVTITINGPAIVEWADPDPPTSPNCGIYELNAGKSFTWNSVGHYWLYTNQASLDNDWPGHLQAYQSKQGNGSCIVGPPS
jgi:hypothetical protein